MATLPPSFLGPQPKYDPIVDKTRFEKELNEVISKALQPNEMPIKEKHVRSCIIATWREKGCHTLWKCVRNHPMDRSSVVCYKSSYIIHKMLRDGYPENAKKSATNAKYISELAKHWNQLGDSVSKMVTSYLKVLWNKIALHVKNPEIPSTLNFTEKPFVVPSDIDHVFQMTVEIFDYQSAILHFYAAVLGTMEPTQSVSTNQMQYRIAPFVPCIKESAALYDLVVKLMKALHTSLPADTLGGHRERFNRQYHALRKYFSESSKKEYIRKFVDVPSLPPDPPNFLIGSFDELFLSQMVFSHDNATPSFSSMDSSLTPSITSSEETSLPATNRSRLETLDGTLIDLGSPLHQPLQQQTPPSSHTLVREDTDSRFQSVFGQQEFEPFVDETVPPPPPSSSDERDILIEQLMREIVDLKDRIRELEEQNEANHDLMTGLRIQLEQRDKEISDYREVAERACNENIQLKQQLETQPSTSNNEESEEKVKAVELKFSQLRDVYQKLRNEHIQLLRTNGDTQKKLNTVESNLIKEENNRVELERTVQSLNIKLDKTQTEVSERVSKMSLLEKSLQSRQEEATKLQQSTSSLQEQLIKSEQTNVHSSIVHAIEQSESIINKILKELDDPSLAGLTCTPEYLLTRTSHGQSVINSLSSSFSDYNKDPSAIGPALATLSSYTQVMSELLLYGVATAHMTSAVKEQKFTDISKSIGSNCLLLLGELKSMPLDLNKVNEMAGRVMQSISQLSKEAQELQRERLAEEEATAPLADIVDEEMASTSLAVNEAARRIEEMLKRSREEQSGVNLEVNSRILDSCTELMKSIQILILRSKDLQQEIVAEGMGSMNDHKDFYKKHHTWSEGLISAAKQVGHGASRLVDSADKVVSGEGKFEPLIVNSKDIAASTAQLVAASKVKARARSEKLKALKASSRTVSDATGNVVASAQSGSELKSEAANKFDFSKLSLNQTKRYEMESQVRALELEKELEMERTKLAELRKVHYHKAGASEGWEETD